MINDLVTDFDRIEIKDDAERIYILRKRLNMSQFQFAKELGISTSYLGQVERGDHFITKNIKDRIQEFLKREKQYREQNILGNG